MPMHIFAASRSWSIVSEMSGTQKPAGGKVEQNVTLAIRGVDEHPAFAQDQMVGMGDPQDAADLSC